MKCQCGYPENKCTPTKHSYGHECVYGNLLQDAKKRIKELEDEIQDLKWQFSETGSW